MRTKEKREKIKIGKREKRIVVIFKDTATTEIYTLSLHDALTISLLKLLQLILKIASLTVTIINNIIAYTQYKVSLNNS